MTRIRIGSRNMKLQTEVQKTRQRQIGVLESRVEPIKGPVQKIMTDSVNRINSRALQQEKNKCDKNGAKGKGRGATEVISMADD